MRFKLLTTTGFLLLGIWASAQTATPTVTNAGGGAYNNPNSYFRYFEWSIGELTLINTVTSADKSLVVYQGVLQPCSDKPGVSPAPTELDPSDYSLFPNPTTGKFEINFMIRSSGTLTLELVDGLGQKIETRSFRYYGCCRVEHYDITNLPQGVYFVSATFKQDSNIDGAPGGLTRHSGIRVVKLR